MELYWKQVLTSSIKRSKMKNKACMSLVFYTPRSRLEPGIIKL
jgi:hypothetical protein